MPAEDEPEAHELATFMPPMTPEKIDSRRADVTAPGLRGPITTTGARLSTV